MDILKNIRDFINPYKWFDSNTSLNQTIRLQLVAIIFAYCSLIFRMIVIFINISKWMYIIPILIAMVICVHYLDKIQQYLIYGCEKHLSLLYKFYTIIQTINKYYLYVIIGIIFYLPLIYGIANQNLTFILVMSSIILGYSVTYNTIRLVCNNNEMFANYIQKRHSKLLVSVGTNKIGIGVAALVGCIMLEWVANHVNMEIIINRRDGAITSLSSIKDIDEKMATHKKIDTYNDMLKELSTRSRLFGRFK